MHPAIPIAAVFFGCCSNVVFLETIVNEVPGCGNIVTFAQFVFITIEGFIFTTKLGSKKPAVPLRYYAFMVSLFFVVQVLNNIVLGFNISMPLQMIFRSGSLVTTLILGMIFLKKRYTMDKFLSVGMISVGIVVCTISSAGHVENLPNKTGDAAYDYFIWLIGVGMCGSSLFLSSWMGIFQENTYKRFGKHPAESLFYNHALPLPGFLLLATDIYKQAGIFSQSAPWVLPVAGLAVPKLWVLLFFNTMTQYVCIRSVFILTTECSSLTVTLVVTLRKFVSLLFSIWYFSNPFTLLHWLGTACVFLGTLMFTEIFPLPMMQKEKTQ